MPHLASVSPRYAIAGGRVTLHGDALFGQQAPLPAVFLNNHHARVVFASPSRIACVVPEGVVDEGVVTVRVDTAPDDVLSMTVAVPVATDLHHVDSPVIDRQGRLYLTYSGSRGQRAPVSIFRVGLGGKVERFVTDIANPTSLAFDAQDRLYVSSRFEGIVYRVYEDGSLETFASDVGIACGLAFGPDGSLYVGDRSGTIFEVDPRGHARAFATLPASIAAFHLTMGTQGMFVTAPTLSPSDAVYHVSFDGHVSVYSRAFGRPQGLTIGPDGALYVVDALAGASGLYRVSGPDTAPELVLAGEGLIGVAFDAPALFVCTADTVYRIRDYTSAVV